MILEHINDIAAICAGHGIQTAIISPGSRSAPLTLAFARHPDITTKVIPDERVAAFVALGMAQQQQKPVVLICTSGSAAYNYAPAVAEAYFQQVPLLLLTADRPPEWIDQYDGQTIRQSGIYGKHVKASFDFPDNPDKPDIEWHGNRMVNEAVLTTLSEPPGPVHINVPLREPFYPDEDEKTFFRKVRLIERPVPGYRLSEDQWANLIHDWQHNSKKLLIGGQSSRDKALTEGLETFSLQQNVPVISDVISNLHGLSNAILHQDALLQAEKDEVNAELVPDLLITFGKSNISKNLKRFLRKHKAVQHWHIQPHTQYQDTFQSLTQVVPMRPADFFQSFSSRLAASDNADYLNPWKKRDEEVSKNNDHFFHNQPFGEFQVVKEVLDHLPQPSQLHLANSMSVRYANYIGLRSKGRISVFCNRGTSGIDGSSSTAVGAALAQSQMVTLITGDMAFFYDRNAFWHNELLPNLRIILLNNHAGGIFRLIKGPSDQPELAEYFETAQRLSAENTAKDFDLEHTLIEDLNSLHTALATFYEKSHHAKVLEVTSDSTQNAAILKVYKQVTGSQ
jgi:2-succinyl-5-enolpyruvyl-6-hydroxy-3-cyclohexene-1-carboxylate synthase